MKLQHLRTLLAIIEHGTFSEAALELDVAQSSVSTAISELEAELGVRLLERGSFGARPTAIGERIAAHARTMEALLEAIHQEASAERGELRGTLRINAFRSVAAKILPGIVAQLRRDHPQLSIRIIERDAHDDHDMSMLVDGHVDLALVSSVAARDALFWEFLCDRYVAVVPDRPGYPTGPVSLDEMIGHPMILGDYACWAVVHDQLKALDLGFQPEFQVHQDSTMLAMVAQGLGVALLPELAVDALPAGVRQLELTDRVERRIGVALTPAGLRSPAVRAFLALLRARFPGSEIPRLEAGAVETASQAI